MCPKCRRFLLFSEAECFVCLMKEIAAHLIDSPRAEGEEASDNYVAWLQFRKGSIRVCDSDAEGAFRVYRHPKEAEGEESGK